MTERPSVLVADAEPALRVGVRLALESGGFQVCAEAANADGAVASALEARPDVCLLAVHMPGGGIEAARRLAELLPDTRVVMLAGSADEQELFEAISAGANGYLLQDTDPARLPLALNGVLGGEAALPRALMLRIIERFRDLEARVRTDSGAATGEPMTEREAAVVDLLRDGVPTSAIARRLGISPITVRRHVSQIVRKLGVPDRAAAVRALRERPPG